MHCAREVQGNFSWQGIVICIPTSESYLHGDLDDLSSSEWLCSSARPALYSSGFRKAELDFSLDGLFSDDMLWASELESDMELLSDHQVLV